MHSAPITTSCPCCKAPLFCTVTEGGVPQMVGDHPDLKPRDGRYYMKCPTCQRAVMFNCLEMPIGSPRKFQLGTHQPCEEC